MKISIIQMCLLFLENIILVGICYKLMKRKYEKIIYRYKHDIHKQYLEAIESVQKSNDYKI